MDKPMKTLELHYPMIQFLTIIVNFLYMCGVQSSTFHNFLNFCLVHKCFGNNHPSQCVRVNLVPRSGNREGDVLRECSRGFLMSLAASCLHLIDRQVSSYFYGSLGRCKRAGNDNWTRVHITVSLY